jgi:hypothetical protein
LIVPHPKKSLRFNGISLIKRKKIEPSLSVKSADKDLQEKTDSKFICRISICSLKVQSLNVLTQDAVKYLPIKAI